jgi:hypothetical protein
MTAPNLWIQAAGGPLIGFGLSGDAQITRSGGSGAGGWQIIDRPRRAATTEWIDYGPFELTMSLILDGYGSALGAPQSIEAAVAAVESWETPVPGSAPPLPPVLTVTGPVPHNELSWVVQKLVWKEAIRDPVTRVRYQQNFDVVLWQYLPPAITTSAPTYTPVSAFQAGTPNTAGVVPSVTGSTYTVKAGDTLQSIAAAIYRSYGYWTLLANANAIRDPNRLTVGQVLTVPAQTAKPPQLSLPSVNNTR